MSLTVHLLGAAAAGIVSHQAYFIHGEHHTEGPILLRVYFLVTIILFLSRMLGRTESMLAAVGTTALLILFYAISLYASMTLYRLLFHRLKKFPGPVMASVTKFWHAYHVLGSKNHEFLDMLHHQYGDFVRTGPNEITIFTPEALPVVYGYGSKCKKAVWYDVILPLLSLNTVREKNVHDQRRRIWDRGFSAKELPKYESRIIHYAKQLQSRISLSTSGDPVDISSLFYFFSFDVMGDLTFGESFGMLASGETPTEIGLLRDGMMLAGNITPVPWLFSTLESISGLVPEYKRMVGLAAERMQQRLKLQPKHSDIMSWLIEAYHNSHGMKRDLNWLNGDSLAIIIAGSDNVAATLIVLFYYLAKDPARITKLRNELQNLPTGSDFKALQSLTYLNALINETLRLYPPIPTGGLRQTPPEGLTVGDQYIPGDTTILTPAYTLGRLESCYERAEEFIPERWFSEPQLVKNKMAFAPFSIGRYNCIGKNLALMEVRALTAILVSQYDFAFGPGDNGSHVVDDLKDVFTISPGKLNLIISFRGMTEV